MPLFQNAVLNKYLSGIDEKKVNEAWEVFTSYFHNPEVQENIRKAKEESYQEGFLDDLFVKVLGYTKSPAPNYNLVVEQKNLTDSKKADGALLDGDKVLGVVELKGTETTDLSKVQDQAFGYKNNQREARYVIISNFEKLRFYIDNAVDFIEFNLFTLTKEEFKVLWLCLGYTSFAKGLPKTIKDASLTEEENVTKKLYKDYSNFKHALFEDIVERNPEHDKVLLFKKTQKLLDRFLFIFFAEDRNLVPPNLIRNIIRRWTELRDDYDVEITLYQRFKKNFNYLNEGYNGKDYEVFAYNGGLFLEDELLDGLDISDEVLYEHTDRLSKYDFETEVDVNILGHIFEHSLNEIEEINAELKGEEVDTSKTRRKKDGVFYTPKYITKYIVEHTVGKLCEEKKAELDIVDERFIESKRRTKKGINDLKNYREWLLSLTICDPACGSGAFLNQALEFLIAEHTYIDELQAKYHGEALVLSDIENQILERNLFGVDINEESVEIAKLSLWLRTAQKGRKLTSLNNHIKCGNSLIDDPDVAGEKAFNWKEEFPDVFANGGFDVVIGNPPYVFTRGNEHLQDFNEYIWSNYKYNHGKINLYSVFLEVSVSKLLREEGRLGFITPETFIRTSTYSEIRQYLINNSIIETLSIYGNGVFENVTAETIAMTLKKGHLKSNQVTFFKYRSINDFEVYEEKQESFKSTPENRLVYGSSSTDKRIFDKIKKDKINLGEIIDVKNGIATKAGKQDFLATEKVSKKYEKLLEAPDLFRYGFEWPGVYINYDKEVLHRPRSEEIFLNDKILIQRVSSQLICSLDEDKYYTFNSVNNLLPKNKDISLKFYLGILNSKLIDYFYRKNYSLDAKYTITVTKKNLDSIPLPEYNNDNTMHSGLENRVDKIINLTNHLTEHTRKFLDLLQSKFDIEKLSRKLQSWHELNGKQFLKELKKKKVELSLDKEAEWLDYFTQQKAKADELKSQIAQTDAEIDKMVYELYGLSEEEVRVVEGEDNKR